MIIRRLPQPRASIGPKDTWHGPRRSGPGWSATERIPTRAGLRAGSGALQWNITRLRRHPRHVRHADCCGPRQIREPRPKCAEAAGTAVASTRNAGYHRQGVGCRHHQRHREPGPGPRRAQASTRAGPPVELQRAPPSTSEMWTWGLHGLSVRRELRFRPRRNSCLIPSRHKTKSLWTRAKRSGRAIFISLLYRLYLASSFVGSAYVDWSYVVIYSSIRLDIWANGIKEGFQLLWHGVMTWVLFFILHVSTCWN